MWVLTRLLDQCTFQSTIYCTYEVVKKLKHCTPLIPFWVIIVHVPPHYMNLQIQQWTANGNILGQMFLRNKSHHYLSPAPVLLSNPLGVWSTMCTLLDCWVMVSRGWLYPCFSGSCFIWRGDTFVPWMGAQWVHSRGTVRTKIVILN